MAMFSKGRGLFGAPMTGGYGTPGYGGDHGASPDASPIQQAATVPTYKKPSTAQFIAGTIGDTLAQIGGGQGFYLRGLQQQQAMAAQSAEAQRAEAAKFGEFRREWDYKRENPQANEGTALRQNYEWLRQVNPALAESYIQNQATAPPIVQANPDGTKTVYPSGSVPRQGGQQQILRELPPGVRPLGAGGATPQGARTFPVR